MLEAQPAVGANFNAGLPAVARSNFALATLTIHLVSIYSQFS